MQKLGFKCFNCLIAIFLCGSFLFFGCSSLKKSLDANLNIEPFGNSLHGLVVVDGNTKKPVYQRLGNTYFTPASNVKIFTFYTGLKLLPERIPTLRYASVNDTLFVEGTGDPTWMHPYFKDSTVIAWLQTQPVIALHLKNFEGERFGPGWAWEDYDLYFSPENNAMPFYGNVVSLINVDSLKVFPAHFKQQVIEKDTSMARDEYSNTFYLGTDQDSLQVPFRTSDGLTHQFLEKLLKRKITLVNKFPAREKKMLYGMETDSIYKRMLLKSDNFLAEQLLITASSTRSDTLGIQRVITYMLENDLRDLDNEPRWVDGSGLSRYNLFTPKSIVQVLQKLYDEVPEQRLFSLFPMWDSTGTVEKWKDLDTKPFVFAKSGSLGNNYNLSGYLKTKSGKLLIFSFMNNHFRISTEEVRHQIYQTLKVLRERY
ncbi:D-alanyl-D-alanine carboxypeptidase/D-alanyl-D-alanine-endopeptidase [Flagellimonas meishanensis]|uniref:D-alanyl-D-alanine carboxypeptidase/D-alanyl-D-alanine-endopeptidase n=1 Tax=Flagellimonas meishanensis TaxID=2873264 RepID=UPI001CA79937|nr:D-alanyl-D-alanine carboxypeptidase [[Muricauda] meishanensis]